MRRTAAGVWREDGDVSLSAKLFLGAFVYAKRRASSRSSLSRRSALAVNWTR